MGNVAAANVSAQGAAVIKVEIAAPVLARRDLPLDLHNAAAVAHDKCGGFPRCKVGPYGVKVRRCGKGPHGLGQGFCRLKFADAAGLRQRVQHDHFFLGQQGRYLVCQCVAVCRCHGNFLYTA